MSSSPSPYSHYRISGQLGYTKGVRPNGDRTQLGNIKNISLSDHTAATSYYDSPYQAIISATDSAPHNSLSSPPQLHPIKSSLQEPIRTADRHAASYALPVTDQDPTPGVDLESLEPPPPRENQAVAQAQGPSIPTLGPPANTPHDYDGDPLHSPTIHPSTISGYRITAAQLLLSTAFTFNSFLPDPTRRACLDLVLQAAFLLGNQLEPLLHSVDGFLAIGEAAINPPRYTLPGSILHVFLDYTGKTCLICGMRKRTNARAVGCVRAHLNHRPFACPGIVTGCTKCVPGARQKRFYTAALLDDHIKGGTWRYPCLYPNCPTTLRRGGQKRHWETIHRGVPFPF